MTTSGIHVLTPKERMKNAFKVFGFFFLLAMASVFIPVLHFILVPLFLLLAVTMPILTYKKMFKVTIETMPCSSCQKALDIRGAYADPIVRIACFGCRTQNSFDLQKLVQQ